MEGWETGHIVAERYRLEEPIGAGGMGMVWRAEHIQLRSPVAIKVLPRQVARDEARSARFIREAQAAAAIRSTNVVQVLDYGVEDGVAYIAMEYLEGESLADRLDRKVRLGARETLTIITQVARAIARAHKKGIIHRDLKPANIFLASEEDGEVVKVLDFGIAKLTDKKEGTDRTTQTGYLLGTPNYMSPEQTRGHMVVDHRTDIWSLGVVAFECLCGVRPIDGETVGDIIYKICSEPLPRPSQVAPVPVGFDRWFRKATERDPDLRFQSARAMALALADAMGSDVPLSEPDTLDSGERVSIELSDTLAAKRASERAPRSDDAITAVAPSAANEPRVSDGETGAGARPDAASDAPVTARSSEPGSELELDEETSDDAAPPRLETTSMSSLRHASAMSRTAETPAAAPQRWLLAAGVAFAAGVILVFVLGRSPAATEGPGAAPPTGLESAPAGASVEPTAEVSEPESAPPVAPSGEDEALSASAAPEPLPSAAPSVAAPPPQRAVPTPRPPRPTPPPTPNVQPPAPGSDKIDFGI